MELVTRPQTINSLTLGASGGSSGGSDTASSSAGDGADADPDPDPDDRDVEDPHRARANTGLDPSAPLVSAVIKMRIEPSTPEESVFAWIQGIGEALAQFDGFHSRKIINLPQTPATVHRHKVVLLKFKSYPCMRKWMDSAELAEWIAKGEAIGLRSERNLSKTAVGSVDLSEFPAASPTAEEGADWPASPPKWKLAMLIEFFVFFTVWTFAAAHVGPKIDAWINGDFGLALFLELCAIVPVISFCLMPAATQLPLVKEWLKRTHAPASDEPWRTLDLGLSIFTPLPPPKPDAALVARLDALERKVDALKAKAAGYHADLVEAGLRKRADSAQSEGTAGGGDPIGTADFTYRPIGPEPQANGVEIRDEGEEVTVSATHYVKWECTDEFARWTLEMAAAMAKAEGFLGSDVFHYDSNTAARVDPSTPHYNPEHVVLFRFASYPLMERWINSDERERQLHRLLPFLESPSHYGQIGGADGFVQQDMPRTHVVNAIDAFGELLASGSGTAAAERGTPRHHPPVWKTTVLTILGLFMVACPVNFNLGPVLPVEMPLPAKVLVLTAINVTANTYVGLPLMSFFFGGWLSMRLPAGAKPGRVHKLLVRGLPGWRAQLGVAFIYFALLGTSIALERNGLLWFATDDDAPALANSTSVA